jgi:hypothetical protein
VELKLREFVISRRSSHSKTAQFLDDLEIPRRVGKTFLLNFHVGKSHTEFPSLRLEDTRDAIKRFESTTGNLRPDLKIPKKGRLPAKKPKNLPPRVGFSDSLPSINGTITKQINVNLINIAIISTIFDEHRSKAIDFYAKFAAEPAGPLAVYARKIIYENNVARTSFAVFITFHVVRFVVVHPSSNLYYCIIICCLLFLLTNMRARKQFSKPE